MAETLIECIRDGSFPDSNELLSQNATSQGIDSLLSSLKVSKDELKGQIQSISQNKAGDVDEWIAQAKKLQEDIERCKVEARQIVEEHQRGEILRTALLDANNKNKLLENEIAFTKALEHEIQSIAEITQVLNEVDIDLSSHDPVSAVGKLRSVQTTIENVSAKKTRSLLSQLQKDLGRKSQDTLEQNLALRWTFERNDHINTLTVSDGVPTQQNSSSAITISDLVTILQAFSELQELPSAVALIVHVIETFFFSIISSKSTPYSSSAEINGDSICVTKSGTNKNTSQIMDVLRTSLKFLQTKLPSQIQESVVKEFLPKVISNLISSWLDPAIPHELHDLHKLEPLQKQVTDLATMLHQYSWPGNEALDEWIDQIPRGWLTKRRMSSLDGVRKAFSLARGTLRQIQRIERQTITLDEPSETAKSQDDDWNSAWDDEPPNPESTEKEIEEDDASGWDFDTTEEILDSGNKIEPTETSNVIDEADAWGWGDDENIAKDELKTSKLPSPIKSHQPNGEKTSIPRVQEMVLTETYHITDIPDYVLEIVGKDIADSQILQTSPTTHLNFASTSSGLAAIPNLALALFRAIAPTYYTLPSPHYTKPLSNIHLYNDTLYLIQKLSESPDVTPLQPSIISLTKFARQIYTSELEVQRTIITDLLDGAQGFERCNTFPNSQACIDAVSSTIDRMRQLHKEWSGILGESHLLQSLGSLMTLVFGKIIKDIEDMDDISESESKQLVTFCQQILSLDDLFSSQLPDLTNNAAPRTSQDEMKPSSQILLYVPNYLRFQYLQQILDSSLVDIKYLWTEGELSLEFSVDEVVDLIKALFAESQHRRGAIRAIRGSTVG